MFCSNCGHEADEKKSGICPSCGQPLGSGAFAPPEGYSYDSGAGLYYFAKPGFDSETGAPVRQVTWFDPHSGEYHNINYPAETPTAAAQQTEPTPTNEPTTSAVQQAEVTEQPPAAELLPPPPPPTPTLGTPTASKPPVTPAGGRSPAQKRSQTVGAVLLAVALIIGVGTAGWYFDWFAPKADALAESSSVPADTVSSTSSAAEPVAADSSPAEEEEELDPPDATIHVLALSPNQAEITVSGLQLRRLYMAATRENAEDYFSHFFFIEVGDYLFGYSYYCDGTVAPDKTVGFADMETSIWQVVDDGLSQVSTEVTGQFDTKNGMLMYNVTLPTDSGVDFTNLATEYRYSERHGNESFSEPFPTTIDTTSSGAGAAENFIRTQEDGVGATFWAYEKPDGSLQQKDYPTMAIFFPQRKTFTFSYCVATNASATARGSYVCNGNEIICTVESANDHFDSGLHPTLTFEKVDNTLVFNDDIEKFLPYGTIFVTDEAWTAYFQQ